MDEILTIIESHPTSAVDQASFSMARTNSWESAHNAKLENRFENRFENIACCCCCLSHCVIVDT